MNEVEYILRIVLKARDELAGTMKKAREELRLLANATEGHKSKIDAFNKSIETMDKNVANITDKFREWRSVIDGTAGGNEDARKSFGQLGREVDATTKKTATALRTQKELVQASRAANREQKDLTKAYKDGNATLEYTVKNLDRVSKELDRYSAKMNSGTESSKLVFKWAQNAKDAADKIVTAKKLEVKAYEDAEKAKVNAIERSNARITQEIEAQLQREEQAEKLRLSNVKLGNAAIAREIDAQIRREAQASKERIAIEEKEAKAIQDSIDLVRDKRRTEARESEIRGRLGGKGPVSDIDKNEAREIAREFDRLAVRFGRTTHEARNLRGAAANLRGELSRLQRDGDRTGSVFGSLFRELRNNGDSIATLDNQLRGLGLLAVVGFAQQLITVLGGLAGGFFSVASSAAEAGAAIGGAFVAGVAQALPVIGLLAGALNQAKGVMDAMKAAQLARQQAFTQGADADKRVADATDTIKNAQEGLANAQRGLKDSQEGLTKAREDARGELEDLIQAENDAKFAAAGAALSQKEAQEALIKAQATGDVEGIQRAQLALLQAQADATDSLTEKRRTAAAAAEGAAGGVAGTEGVEQAKRQVEDAERAVARANRQVQTAKRNAGEAAAGADTAASKLQFLLSQMTKGQVALFHALDDLRTTYLKVFGPINDIILGSFTRTARRITTLIQMPEVIAGATKLATEISKQLNRISDAFLGDKMIAQFLRIAEEGRKNLRPVTDILINLGKSFLDIAEDAGPSFARMIRFIGRLVDSFADLVSNRRAMTEFFNDGEKHFEAWIKLGLAVINLFLALAGAGGAREGLNLVNDATKAINDLIKQIGAHRDDVSKFFGDSREIIHEVVGVIVALAEELYNAFTPERVHNFAKLLKDVVIPALGDVVTFLGDITEKLLEFADTPIGGEILKAVVISFALQRVISGVLGSFKLLTVVLGPAAKILGEIVGRSKLFSKFIEVAAKLLPRFASFVPFAGWAIAIALLLHQLGLLDDAWDAIKGGFEELTKEVRPALGRLVKSFKELWDAISSGKGFIGALMDGLRPILKVVIQLGAIFLRVFGRTLGRIISGVIDVLAGFMTFLTGVFTGDWRKAWRGIVQIFRGIWRAIFALIRALPELIYEIGKKILPALKDGIEALWDWLGGLPRRLGNIASQGAKAFVGAFKSVGSDIIKGIASGLRATGGFARDLANSFIDLLNALLPNRLAVPGAPDINLPDNPIPHLEKGGPAKGSREGFLAVLHPEEHVWTADEVAAAGGHAAMFAMRRFFGGGGQGSGGRYQRGGRASGADAGSLTIAFQGGELDDFASTWRQFWNILVLSARRATNAIEQQFREMRVKTAQSADRMYRDVRSSLDDIGHSFEVRSRRIINNWSDTWQSLKKVTAEGLFYIGHETNKALRGLGEKNINFGFEPPKKADTGKASGGFIGRQGQRGKDRGFYALGDGEAVLNWAHQKYIAPAVESFYGHPFSETFNRVRGFHAGGPEQMGFAGGRAGTAALFDGHPSNVVSGILQLVRILKKRFPGLMVTSTRDHSVGTSTGGISDHPSGHAVDLASADYSIMSRATQYINASGIWKRLKQGIHNPGLAINAGQRVSGPGFFAGAWPQHLNHIHLAMAGALGDVADMITSVGRPIITGAAGALRTIAQAAIDKTRRAANKLLDDKTAASADVVGTPGPGSPAPEGQHKEWIRQGLRLAGVPVTDANINAQYRLDMGESGGDPSITQRVHDINSVTGNLAEGIAQVIPPTFAAYKVRGHNDIHNPVDNIAASARYQIAKYGHLVGHPGYAKGGEIPGVPGEPVPILAHAREWVLNRVQQSRLARMLGTNTAALRSMLGFSGSMGRGFQAGGEVPEGITPLTGGQVKGISDRALRRLIVSLRKIGENIDSARAHLGSVESWSRYLDQTASVLRRTTTRIQRKGIQGRNLERGVMGFLETMEKLIGEGGVFENLRTSIERRAARAARVLTRAQFRVRGGVVTAAQGAVTIARDELGEQRRQRGELVGERDDIRRSLRQVRRQQRRKGLTDTQKQALQAQEVRLIALRDEAAQRVVDNISAISDAEENLLQARIEKQQKIVDKINARFEQESGNLELFRRVGEALGNEGVVAQVNNAQRDMLRRQADELQGRIAAARAAGANELADQLATQVADLQVQIFESIQQNLRDTADRVNNRASRRLGRLDLAGRLLDAVGAVGLGSVAGLAGERFSRGGLFGQRQTALEQQRAGLQGVLRGAEAQGNVGLIQELTDQLAELDVAIQENTKAARNARIEDINSRATVGLTQNDLKQQIITLTGEISGNTDQVALLRLAQEKTAVLETQRRGLLAELARAQREGDAQAVQDLTTQLLENQVALLQNTKAIDEMNGTMKSPQTFTSSAWTWFREAIFSGMGQVLPQYDPGNLMGGVNTGAVIAPSYSTASSRSINNNITLNEVGRPVDLTEVSSAVTFASKTAQ